MNTGASLLGKANPHYGKLQSIANPEAGRIWRSRFDEPEPVEVDITSDWFTPDYDIDADYARKFWLLAMEGVTGKEAHVLDLRLTECMSLAEVADYFGVTKERIRQIEAKALRKIRQQAYRGVFSKLGDLPTCRG